MRIICILFLLLETINLIFADSPPAWEEYDVFSANNQFIAEIRKEKNVEESQKIKPPQQKFIITVFEIENKKKIKIWSCGYNHRGYPGGILTEDGEKFVYIMTWYFEDLPIVTIYNKGEKIIHLFGKYFLPKLKTVAKSYYHQRWLLHYGEKYSIYRNILEIKLINNEMCYVDINNGEFVDTREDTRGTEFE